MKYIIAFLVFLQPWLVFSQVVIFGYVLDKQNSEALPSSTVLLLGTKIGTSTDSKGHFQLTIPNEITNPQLAISFIGYQSDTMNISDSKKSIKVFLTPNSKAINEVVISGTMQEMSKLDSPILVEVYNSTFFKKNPTPNIFESLSMVNGVQPQLNCNVCNTGDIHINGMEGPYTMILIDGMPIVSSLSTVYGLSGIPNSMVKRIEIVKGPASTLYGSEAVGGLINIITKDPLSSPRWKGDFMATSMQEFNGDLSTKFKVKGATSMVGLNGFWFNKLWDVNSDGFTDVTIQKRFSVFNKWDFERKSGKNASLAVRYVHENRWGGQTNWTEKFRGSDSIYGESIYTNRFELIGNYELPFKSQHIRLQYSYNVHHQDSYYGTVKYLATQHTAFAQLLWDRNLGHHYVLVGLPFRFGYYDDNSPATANPDLSNQPQLTYLPGIFAQDEWKLHKKFSTLVGLRYDRNNLHGNIFTPRLSFKYSPNSHNTIRLSGGNGYRVVNLFTEDHAALTGARIVEIREALKPEQSWNANLNYATQLNHKSGFIGLDFSVFYTYFTNKIVADYLTDANKIIYDNLKGYAISQGFTLNSDFSFT
ncbi:MAG: TonB-dependent receptor, partial [Cytophagales bacterium]|nr:TonB-dependent receptor [Cytophagales bacterium]